MKTALLYLWQSPQHLLGLLLIAILKAERHSFAKRNGEIVIPYWEFAPAGKFARYISGTSLGRYIILPAGSFNEETLLHEYGHSRQSLRWGPLYLLTVGIPSAVFCNLWDRQFHKGWTVERRREWYYKRWPEKQADKLGGVVRG